MPLFSIDSKDFNLFFLNVCKSQVSPVTPSELHPRVQNLGVSKLVSEIHNKSWPLLTKKEINTQRHFFLQD